PTRITDPGSLPATTLVANWVPRSIFSRAAADVSSFPVDAGVVGVVDRCSHNKFPVAGSITVPFNVPNAGEEAGPANAFFTPAPDGVGASALGPRKDGVNATGAGGGAMATSGSLSPNPSLAFRPGIANTAAAARASTRTTAAPAISSGFFLVF